MHKDQQEPEQRHESLLCLYKETWEEIRRLREFEWKIAATFVTLAAGFVVLICSESAKPFLTQKVCGILIGGQILAVGFGIYCLCKTHYFLMQQRNIRRTIEDILNFHEQNVFTNGAVLPQQWKGKRVTFSFQMGLLIPLIAVVIFVQALAIYITWASSKRLNDIRPERCRRHRPGDIALVQIHRLMATERYLSRRLIQN